MQLGIRAQDRRDEDGLTISVRWCAVQLRTILSTADSQSGGRLSGFGRGARYITKHNIQAAVRGVAWLLYGCCMAGEARGHVEYRFGG
jgi:hypothetical protein